MLLISNFNDPTRWGSRGFHGNSKCRMAVRPCIFVRLARVAAPGKSIVDHRTAPLRRGYVVRDCERPLVLKAPFFETRMQSWEVRKYRGSRRRTGISRRRILMRLCWFGRFGQCSGSSRARSSGPRRSRVMESSPREPGSSGPTSTMGSDEARADDQAEPGLGAVRGSGEAGVHKGRAGVHLGHALALPR